MSLFLDGGVFFALAFLLFVGGAALVGFLVGGMIGVAGSIIAVGLYGLVLGNYVESTEGSWIAFLLVSLLSAAVLLFFLPIDVTWGLVVFLIGYAAGMRLER